MLADLFGARRRRASLSSNAAAASVLDDANGGEAPVLEDGRDDNGGDGDDDEAASVSNVAASVLGGDGDGGAVDDGDEAASDQSDAGPHATRRRSPQTSRGKRRRLIRLGLEKPMGRQHCLDLANKAKKAKHEERSGAVGNEAVATVSAMVNNGVLLRRREQLQADCTRTRTPKGVDGRTWMSGGVLRRVFKEHDSYGRAVSTKMFDIGCGNSTDQDALVCVAESILQEQRERISLALETHKASGRDAVCSIYWEMDGTPQLVKIMCGTAVDKLNSSTIAIDDVQPATVGIVGTREVLVQRGRCFCVL